MGGPHAPVLPQMMCEETDQHCSRTKVGVPRCFEGAHGCIDQWKTGHASFPSLNEVLIVTSRLLSIAAINIFKFHSTFHFKFLNEMAVPVQTRLKGIHGARPALPFFLLLQRLIGLAHTEISPRQIGRQSRAVHSTVFRFGDKFLITPSAFTQEAI